MKKIALVSIALGAVQPMTDYLLSEGVSVVNYLDTYVTDAVNKFGVTEDLISRMENLIIRAANDGAEGIILTCTIFSPYIERFQEKIEIPIIGADSAMVDSVGKIGGKTALICTFKGTVEISSNALKNSFLKYQKPYELDVFLLEDAFEKAKLGKVEEHYEIIANKIKELDGKYENIVLAQISMAKASEKISTNSKVFTSPKEAYNAIKIRK